MTKHAHYFKDVSRLETIDVYRVLQLFNVTDPCLQHAIKKLLVAGGRGAGKDIHRDIQEAVDSLTRWQEMRSEEAAPELVDTASLEALDRAWELRVSLSDSLSPEQAFKQAALAFLGQVNLERRREADFYKAINAQHPIGYKENRA